tara:strand:- start:273 stop:728 length:456 start_codon:yes stop_codon:yes gene_type:complete
MAGIPPSLDRQERLWGWSAVAVVFVALFLVLMYFFLHRKDSVDALLHTAAPVSSDDRLDAYLEEKERASAYQAVRDALDQKSAEPGIAAVFCRDCRHTWRYGRIEFRGEVDFQRPGGQMIPHTYIAILSGSDKLGWKMESLDVTPRPEGSR